MEDIFIMSVHTSEQLVMLEEVTIIGKNNIDNVLSYMTHKYGQDVIMYLNRGYICLSGFIVKGDFIRSYVI